MSKEEIKQEISEMLDQFSDKALADLLSFLKSFQNKPSVSLLSADNFRKVLAEDKDLLQRLTE